MWSRRLALGLGVAIVAVSPARAEVVERFEGGFVLRDAVQVAAAPERVYEALGQIGRWWSGSHTYSGEAANLSLALQPGGCFCEALEGGGVRHGVVLMAQPAKLLRLDAPLGPLQQEGVAAVLTIEIKAQGEGAEVVQTYRVGGARPQVVRDWPQAVDQVLSEQLQRLARYVETGRPE